MSKHRNRAHRDDLVGEHPFGDTGQLILLIIFLVVWIIDSFVLRLSIFIVQYVSLFLRVPLGIVFLFFAGYLTQQGLRVVFGEERTEPRMIEKGVFMLVRHPVYLGCILFYVGMVMFTLSIFAAIICVVIIIFYHYISRYEEKLLLAKFGREYELYMQSVPMWIPRVKTRLNR